MWIYGVRKWLMLAWVILLMIAIYPLYHVIDRMAGPDVSWPAVLIGLLLILVASWLGYRLLAAWWGKRERMLAGVPAVRIASAYAGMICGLAVGLLLHPALASSANAAGGGAGVVPLMVDVLLGLIGYRIGQLKSADFAGWFDMTRESSVNASVTSEIRLDRTEFAGKVKLLDSSAIIDGRIADIRRAGFLEGTMIVPDFVIQELQQIADSSDMLKRNRGRRGLDILQQMQRECPNELRLQDVRIETGDVDTRLIRLAKTWQAKIVTNDFNLSKVCDLHGVAVLNMNALANAMKSAVLPGEEFRVHVIKDGKEVGQGIGYLDDGTMVVVDGGKLWLGHTIDVIVSSVLQTAAGKMIFSRRKIPTDGAVVASEPAEEWGALPSRLTMQ
jgi:uncharacterized protein YacL